MKQIETKSRTEMSALVRDVNMILIENPQARLVTIVCTPGYSSPMWVAFIEYDIKENKDVP